MSYTNSANIDEMERIHGPHPSVAKKITVLPDYSNPETKKTQDRMGEFIYN